LLASLPAVVAEYFGCKKSALLNGRSAHTAYPRKVLFYLARELSFHSWLALGRLFDRHHTTLLWAHEKIAKRLAADDMETRCHVRAIVGKLRRGLPEAVPARICPTCHGEGTVDIEEEGASLLH
jgi:DnaA-like protein